MLQENVSLISSLGSLPLEQKIQYLASLTDEECYYLLYDWQAWARPNQLPPEGDWDTWLILAGRGFGKTRTGAEWVRYNVEQGIYSRIALVAPTASDARDVMVEGESGILAKASPWFKPHYSPSKRCITWPNGAVAYTYSADEPDRLRGPQHDAAWCDELASWRYTQTYDMLQFGLRLGTKPRKVITTTPRPTQIVKEIMNHPSTHVTRGSTYDNRSNMAATFFTQIIKKYEGTRLGRQELLAEILDDNPYALFKMSDIEVCRVSAHPQLRRVVIAVDPAVTSEEDSDETGIIACGIGIDEEGYVLGDRSNKGTPDEWASAAVSAYREFNADRIIVEVNNGGDLVSSVIRSIDKNVPITQVRASRGKQIRAEPVAALYEQQRIHHVGQLTTLEDQMLNYDPVMSKKSPDRMDALVWGLTALFDNQSQNFAFGTL